ncbi:electron transfer flavoprotein subunit alpha/FixB family protein [Chrysiogenes arsenatis]|uniref:electron transfer flavoprotein subunit alpha/FixB family protein n=1 Tax=Chrysiogenes arsenatis TaxID=309797 RepID=UPI000413A78F|nr:electron transfer flavoprotein subunit alpha/FixB family protein [Chrysiogenes arsenatis]
MKVLAVGEYRENTLLESTYELLGFAKHLGADVSMVLVGRRGQGVALSGTLYLADVNVYHEYNPELHTRLVLQAAAEENPDLIVFLHSSYGWDLAPRVAAALGVAQISEVIGVDGSEYEVPCCNAKMRRKVSSAKSQVVLTLQPGAFTAHKASEDAKVVSLEVATESKGTFTFVGYEAAEAKGVDLSRAEVIVTAGRGIGKKDNVAIIADLAKALKGELGASRPVVDAGWVPHDHQVGTTGQTVSPKLYIACGVSGAIQHLAGMKKSDFIVAINKDRDAPIGEVADVLVVADVMQFVPALTAKVSS